MLNLTTTLGVGVSITTSPPAGPSTPSTPSTPTPPDTGAMTATGTTKVAWDMRVGETIYINIREGSPGPLAWVAYTVAHVFADGNAAVVRDPGFVAYTGDLSVGSNLRRKGERYADTYPGP